MNKMVQLIKNEEGQSLVEYGLILGIISVATTGALIAMKGEISKVFAAIGKQLKAASSAVGK